MFYRRPNNLTFLQFINLTVITLSLLAIMTMDHFAHRSTASTNSVPRRITELERSKAMTALGRLPLMFEANRGQTDERVKFISRGAGYTFLLKADEAVLSIPRPNRSNHSTAHDQSTV